MSEIGMIERVARAICENSGLNPDQCVMGSGSVGTDSDGQAIGDMQCHVRAWENYTPDARASIAAMREPTTVMRAVFIHKALHGDVLSHGGWNGYARDQWIAMIDAALRDPL